MKRISNHGALLIAILLAAPQMAFMNPIRDGAQKGIDLYSEGDYESALQTFADTAAKFDPESKELHFNIGNAWFQQQDYEKAIAEYQQALGAGDKMMDAQTYYNMGNAYLESEDYKSAVAQYIQSLKNNPNDASAKKNLEIALRKQRQKEQEEQSQQDQEKKDENQDENQDDKKDGEKDKQDQQKEDQQQDKEDQKQEDQQDEQQGQQDEDGQDQQDQQQQEPNENEPQNQPQAGQPDKPLEPQELTPEQAMQLLQSMERQEQDRRKQMRRVPVNASANVEKDW